MDFQWHDPSIFIAMAPYKNNDFSELDVAMKAIVYSGLFCQITLCYEDGEYRLFPTCSVNDQNRSRAIQYCWRTWPFD